MVMGLENLQWPPGTIASKAKEGLTSFLVQDVRAPMDLVAMVPNSAAHDSLPPSLYLPSFPPSVSHPPPHVCVCVCVYWDVKGVGTHRSSRVPPLCLHVGLCENLLM